MAQPNVMSPLLQHIGKVSAFCTTAPGAIAAQNPVGLYKLHLRARIAVS
jgi:hypothetical protein